VRVDQALEQDMAAIRAQVLQEPELDTIEEGGEAPTVTHGTATWVAEVQPTSTADLFRLSLTIRLPGDGDTLPEREVSQTLFVLRPDWSDPVERDKLREESRKRLEELKRGRAL
jgi:general secretion pathway protein I